jgi:hypothetical protein
MCQVCMNEVLSMLPSGFQTPVVSPSTADLHSKKKLVLYMRDNPAIVGSLQDLWIIPQDQSCSWQILCLTDQSCQDSSGTWRRFQGCVWQINPSQTTRYRCIQQKDTFIITNQSILSRSCSIYFESHIDNGRKGLRFFSDWFSSSKNSNAALL